MPTFELTAHDGKVYEIDADDIGKAQQAFAHAFGGSNGGWPAPTPPADSPFGFPVDPAQFDPAAGARATQEAYGGYNGPRAGDPGDRRAELGNELTRKADEMLVGPDSAINAGSAALLNLGKTFGLNLPQNIGAGLASLPGIGNGHTFRENFQLADDQLAALGRQQPGARDLGTIGGFLGSLRLPMLTPFGGGSATAQVGNAAVTGGAMAGVGTAADAGLDRITDPGVAAKTAGMTLAGAGLGAGLQGVTNYLAGRAARKAEEVAPSFPKGVSPAVAAEAEAGQFGIPLSKGQSTGDYAQQARESLLARGPADDEPAKVMRGFFEGQERAVGAAKEDVGRRLAGGADLVERPYDAGVRVADFARNSQRLADTVAQGQEAAAAAARGRLAPADPANAASDVAAGVRDRAAADRAQFKASYGEAAREPGAFEAGTFEKVAPSIEARMAASERPIPVDPTLTPAASRAMADLRASPPAGSSMAEVDQARRRLVALRGSTGQNPTDRAAMDQIIRHFDDHVEDALAANLFSGSDRALDLYRKARGEFAAYQKTFRPQGAGDDVGRAMQQIVDRNAQPQEVANLLWGTSLTGNTGRAMRLADRLKEMLPPELWEQTQRGYLGRIVGDGVESGRIVGNIQKALSGEGRGLSYKLLSDSQVAGLRSIQSGLKTAASVREAVPEWVRGLGRRDFEPQSVVDNLFGKGTMTGNAASALYARGIRDMVGANSETWSAIRQAGWQHLTMKPAGATADYGPQALANRITTFLEGNGRSLAHALYTEEERATMKALANVLKVLTPKRMAGGSASPNSDTAPMMMRTLEALKRHEGKISMLLAGAGFVKGGPAGAAAAYGIGKGAEAAASRLAARKALREAREAVGGAPAGPPAAPSAPRPLTGLLNPASRLLLQLD